MIIQYKSPLTVLECPNNALLAQGTGQDMFRYGT